MAWTGLLRSSVVRYAPRAGALSSWRLPFVRCTADWGGVRAERLKRDAAEKPRGVLEAELRARACGG